MSDNPKLDAIYESLRELEDRITLRRRMETRGSTEYRLWTEDLKKCRDLIDLVELGQHKQIIL